MCNCVRPSGRHAASGLSLLLFAFRSARTCAPQAVIGGSFSGKPAPMLKNCPTGGSPGADGISNGSGSVPFMDSPPRPPPPLPRAGSHNPAKSGLPSAVRGGAPARSILPSFVLGPAVGYGGHCARAGIAPAKAASRGAAIFKIFIFVLLSTNQALSVNRAPSRSYRVKIVLGNVENRRQTPTSL